MWIYIEVFMVRYNKSRIDHIFETWSNNQQKSDGLKVPKLSVTISCKCGDEGNDLANRLCVLLKKNSNKDWHIYEQQLIEDVSTVSGIQEQFLKDVGVQKHFFDNFYTSLLNKFSDREAFLALIEKIASVAKKGNVIMIGRGAEIITKNYSNCLHYRLESPIEYRTQLVSKKLNISLAMAMDFVIAHQEKREQFIEKYFSCKLGDPFYYHAIYNTSKKTLDRIALNICGAVLDMNKNTMVEQA
jgi:cytidylate kinase